MEFWSVTVPLLAGVAGWIGKEAVQRAWENQKAKRESYQRLLDSLPGLYGQADPAKVDQFLAEIRRFWLMCPDHVIRKANELTEAIKEAKSDTIKERLLGELLIGIRRDITSWQILPLRGTRLAPDDFRIETAKAQKPE